MSLIVYAVCRTGTVDAATLPAGCGGASVHAICTERCTALFSEHTDSLKRPTDADFEAFDGVIEAAHLQTTTLPVRFGTTFSDDALLSRQLRLRTDALEREMERMDDLSELTITVRRAARVVTRPARVASPIAVGALTDGTGALRSVPAGGGGDGPSDAGGAMDMVEFCRGGLSDLGALAEEVRVEGVGASRDAGVMRCLVKRGFVPLFQTAFEDLREEIGFDGTLGVPSPCYSFATQNLL